MPGGHAGVANSGADGVVDVPFGIVERLADELRGAGVERPSDDTLLFIETAMTEGAVHRIELDAVDKIVVSRRKRIVHAGSAALHGGIERGVGDAGFESRWHCVGTGRRKAQQGNAQAEQHEHD